MQRQIQGQGLPGLHREAQNQKRKNQHCVSCFSVVVINTMAKAASRKKGLFGLMAQDG